jgi:hypothetical protein
VHPERPGVSPCFGLKPGYACVPLHISKMDLPLAPGLGQLGGGYQGVSYGVLKSGGSGTFASYTPCLDQLMLPGTAPGAIAQAATTTCHDWYDHPGYCSYYALGVTAAYFTIIANGDEHWIKVINCQANYDPDPIIGDPPNVNGQAQWGGTQTILCGTDPTAVEVTTWGKIKGLYR